VIVAASAGRGPAVGWLSARPLVAIGVISYGIYLWHLPLLLVTRNAGLMPDAFVLRLVVMLVLALAAGFASWRLVERPLIRRFGGAGEPASPRRRRPVRGQSRGLASGQLETAPRSVQRSISS
jgi:peptidoglycan/LPS O-acetylase OafA/YrhL